MCYECYSRHCICAYDPAENDYGDEDLGENEEWQLARPDDELYLQYEQERKDAEDESIGTDNFEITIKGGRESASLRAMKRSLPIVRLLRGFEAREAARTHFGTGLTDRIRSERGRTGK